MHAPGRELSTQRRRAAARPPLRSLVREAGPRHPLAAFSVPFSRSSCAGRVFSARGVSRSRGRLFCPPARGRKIWFERKKNNQNKIYSNGGRVLIFVVLSDSFKYSREKAIKLINELNWSNGFFRTDIGFKVIK